VAEETVVIARRFRGPLRSANGGYAAGRLAAHLDGRGGEVTLLAPPPLDAPLRVTRAGAGVQLYDGELLVAEGRPGDPALEPPPPPSWETAAATTRPDAGAVPEFAECFVCGDRPEGDGLAIHAGPVAGGELVATTWTARDVAPEIVWAAIDCPGAYAVGGLGRGAVVLARMTASIRRLPREGERCVVAGWPLGEDGRKLHAGTALYAEDGDVLAVARQLWIAPVA
jgi:hypothetical protein